MKNYIVLFILAIFSHAVVAEQVSEISLEQFHQEWQVSSDHEVLRVEDGTPLFRLDAEVTLAWTISRDGNLEKIEVLEESPADQGVADAVKTMMYNSELQPRIDNPQAPVRVTGTFKYRSTD